MSTAFGTSPRAMSDTAVHLGTSWYPEMWPEEEWPKDIARMKEVGFTLVRLFEFAWKRLEPSEDVYEFDWARDILDQLHAAGIEVMLGTPTAAPPAWLTSANPDVLQTNADGKVALHGKRKHYNHHSRTYRRYARRIASTMARELGSHPAVHSWQIDNEMSGFDYGDETRKAFHAWLKNKYGDIGTLNRTWGLDFWSQAYDAFAQIPLCTASVGSVAVPERHHPSLIMAIARFQNEGWTRFMKEQYEAIREHSPHPITSNRTGFIGGMDWSAHSRLLDRSGTSTYADLSYFHYHYSKFDRLRPEKRHPYWVMETAPNWSGGGTIWNIHHCEAGVRAFTWTSILLGGSMVLYWQWRSHWAGQEMQHGTCVSQTGQWMPGRKTWKQLASEFREHGQWLIDNTARRRPMSVIANSENAWLYSIDPVHPEHRYGKGIIEDFYMPLKRAHFHRDVIDEAVEFWPYQVIVCPGMAILRPQTRERLERWVRDGGRLVIGPLTGTRSEEMTAWTKRTFGGLESLMGGESALRFTPHWVEESISVSFTDGTTCHPKFWCEAFEPHEGTDVLAFYQGGYGDSLPAVLSRKLGKGRVVSLGCPVDEASYLGIVRDLAAEVGLKTEIASDPGILACPRMNKAGKPSGIGLVNTTKECLKATLPRPGTDLLSGEEVSLKVTLEPLDVMIIRYT